MEKVKISILITTKNRLTDLKFTLAQLTELFTNDEVECLLYDDASTDGTFEFVKENYPAITLFRNEKSLGLIHNRNVLLNSCNGEYAISLDDDAHFLSSNVFNEIVQYFTSNPKCAVIACRIFWGKEEPSSKLSNEQISRVKGFVGCGHVWNLKAWRDIPNYPEWFVFYGEEEFASYQLFKSDWEIHYVPDLFVQHRVEVKARKKDSDYLQRQRRSFRSGWYLYLMFFPLKSIPKKMAYTLWAQIKNKFFKGDFKASCGVFLAILDVFVNLPKIIKARNRFSKEEFQRYSNLEPTKIYWRP